MNYRARMFEEHSDLRIKIKKLKEFILSEKYDNIPDMDKSNLKEQLKHMEGYFRVLSCRVSRQANNS